MSDEIVGYACPICNTPNPLSTNYCLKCSHWLLDTKMKSKPITKKEYKKYFSGTKGTSKKLLISGLIMLAIIASFYIFEKNKISSKDIATSLASTISQPATPIWNTSEPNVGKNGNFSIALNALRVAGNTEQGAMDCIPKDVLKRPWDYYGKIIKISGKVGLVQDYPPSSSESISMSGPTAQIVVLCNDGTTVYDLVSGNSGTMRIGNTISVYGFPIGTEDVTNKLGKVTTGLVMVGNKFNIIQ